MREGRIGLESVPFDGSRLMLEYQEHTEQAWTAMSRASEAKWAREECGVRISFHMTGFESTSRAI
jgi:hypothetical protein